MIRQIHLPRGCRNDRIRQDEIKPRELKRLDQLIANCGYASRSEAKGLIKVGRVRVDGDAVTDPGLRVPAGSVTFDGQPLEHPDGLFIMLNKPLGYACSRDPSEFPLVFDLLPELWNRRNPAICTIGRLDRDTSGLLLLTDIPSLVHKLASPKSGTEKVYEAVLDKPLRPKWIELFASGVLLLSGEEKPCRPARLDITSEKTARLTLTEGRFHQVRRMFETVGRTVLSLRRVGFGPWRLGNVRESSYVHLAFDNFR